MKILSIILMISFVFSGGLMAEDKVEWHTDFEKAKAAALESEKPILVNFSGSDWCRWCIKLSNEVFQQETFENYAKDNLILFVADFPRTKEISKSEQAQNKALAEKFQIRGFPTVVLLDSLGEKIAQTGYREGGPEAYVDHLKELLN